MGTVWNPCLGRGVSQGPSVLAPGRSIVPKADFLPQADEPLHVYRARLRAMHDHLSTLIDAIERGGDRPVLISVPKADPAPTARSFNTAERLATARLALERQLHPDEDPFAAPPGLHDRLTVLRERIPSRSDVDPVVVCWAINVACWLLVVAVAMVWGLGSS
jgi:hypothetical protein